jgi:hypothetical protein
MAIPDGEQGFTDSNVVAYLSLAQPILKSDLKDFCGCLSDETLLKLQGVILRNLGLVQAVNVDLPNPAESAEEVG